MSTKQKNSSLPTTLIISPYEILNVSTTTPVKEIRRAYKDLVRIHTPEHDPERFMEIRQAYDTLLTPEKEVTRFPVYKKPIQKILNQKAVTQNASLSVTLLQKIFETPFDTYTELETMLKQEDSNS